MDLVRQFTNEVSRFLKPNGLLAMEVGHEQGEASAELLRAQGLHEVNVKKDLSEVPRFPFARAH